MSSNAPNNAANDNNNGQHTNNNNNHTNNNQHRPIHAAVPIVVPPEGANLEQVPASDPDVLFRGAFGAAMPQFSVTINRTNIGPQGGPVVNGEPVFNLSNIPPMLRDMIENVMQQQGSHMRSPKKATEDAIRHLETINPADLSESERTCPICYESFDTPIHIDTDTKSSREKDLERKRALEERTLMLDSDPGIWFPTDPTAKAHSEYHVSSKAAQARKEQEEKEESEREHVPVKMPCNHIFGRSCLVEWLKSNVSCPLCRREVESQPAGSGSTPAAEMRAQSLIINRSFCPADWSSAEQTYEDPAIPIPTASSFRSSTTRPRRVIELTQPRFW